MIAKRSLRAVFKFAAKQISPRFFSKGGFIQESDEFEEMGNRAFYGADSQNFSIDRESKRTDYKRKERIPFSTDTLAIFTDYSKSEAMERIHSAKLDQTTEDFLLIFFDSMRSKNGHVAFIALTPEKRERFVENLLSLIHDSLTTQTRMSISQFARVTFSLLLSTDSIQLTKKLLESLFSMINSIPIKYNIVNSFFLSAIKKKNKQNVVDLQECAEFCRNILFEILNDSRTRIDGRSVPGISHALSNYLNFVSDIYSKTEIKNLSFMIERFLNLSILDLPPMSLVVGYSSIANLIDSKKLEITIANKENINFMQNAIEKYFTKETSADQEESDENATSKLVSNKVGTGKHLNTFIQAYFIENEENWNYKNILLYTFAKTTYNSNFEYQFKRWVNKLFITEGFSFTSFHEWEQTFTIINVFLKGKSFHKLKMKLLIVSKPYFERVFNPDRLVDMFSILFPFKALISGAPPSLNAKFDVEKEFSEDEKKVVREIFALFKSKLFSDAKEMNSRSSVKVIKYFKLEYDSISIDELKSSKLHIDLWSNALKPELPFKLINDLLSIIPAYDIVRDTEMQTKLLAILKDVKDLASIGEKRGKGTIYANFLPIYDLFETEKEVLSPESKMCFDQLTKIKNLMESGN